MVRNYGLPQIGEPNQNEPHSENERTERTLGPISCNPFFVLMGKLRPREETEFASNAHGVPESGAQVFPSELSTTLCVGRWLTPIPGCMAVSGWANHRTQISELDSGLPNEAGKEHRPEDKTIRREIMFLLC